MSSNEYMRDYMRARYHARRTVAIEKLGGKCVDCSSLEELEFDHVDRETKKFDLSSQTLSGVDFWSELEKCVLRCNSCHRQRSTEQMSVEHGGGASGKKNCKCAPCKEKKSEYMREYMRRRRQQV